MLGKTGAEIIWYAHFTSDGEGEPGLSPTITVYKDDDATPEVDAAAMTELGDGLYYHKQTPTDAGVRVAVAKTASTDVDQRHIPAVMLIGKAGVDHLDATISSRATTAELEDIKGENWSPPSDTLEGIREAVANVPAQRRTQEI